MQHKIGIIRESKFPPDSRVALIPAQIKILNQKKPDRKIVVQPSNGRCYSNDEFLSEGITLQEDLTDCDILLGVKEVPYDLLVQNKTYLFFSHTIKKQPQNKKLLQALLEKKITMIDYETLKDDKGTRVIAFGKWAGIIGGHNALWTYAQRTNSFKLKRAKDCKDYNELISLYASVKIPPVKIILTGTGRVAQGVIEIFKKLKIKETTKSEFLNKAYRGPVFLALSSNDLYSRKNDGKYNRKEYYKDAGLYKSDFMEYAAACDILINAIFWSPAAPRLFEKQDMYRSDFKIKTIADLACDVNGGIPATIRSTTINEPVYGYDIQTDSEIAPYIPESIDIMAIDNLPNELPRNASEEFGKILMKDVWEELFKEDSAMIHNATITKNGKLNKPFLYLADYAS